MRVRSTQFLQLLIAITLVASCSLGPRSPEPPSYSSAELARSADIIKIIKSEAQYSSSILQPYARLTRTLIEELSKREPPPFEYSATLNGYRYQSRMERGWGHPLVTRTDPSGKTERVVNFNDILALDPLGRIGTLRVSPSNELAASTVTRAGHSILWIHNILSGEDRIIEAPSEETFESIEWGRSDSELYITTSQQHRPSKLYLISNLNEGELLPLLYEAKNETFLWLKRSGDGQRILINREGLHDAEVLTFENGTEVFTRYFPYHVQIQAYGDTLGVLSSHRFELISLISGNSRVIWKDTQDFSLTSFVLTQFFCGFISREHDGTPGVRVLSMGTGKLESVPLPLSPLNGAYGLELLPAGFEGDQLDIAVSSITTPRELLTVIPSKLKASWNKSPSTPYHSVRRFVKSKDGVQVPLSLSGRPQNLDSGAPVLLNVYGAYGKAFPTELTAYSSLLMDRGWVVAICHTRGGGEFGARWHEAAQGVRRKHAIEDLAACVHDLKRHHSRKIALRARSAGAIAAIGAIRADPSLVDTLLLDVPFLAPPTTVGKDLPPLAVREFSEWGDPRLPKELDYLVRISPIRSPPSLMPKTLIRIGLEDDVTDFRDALNFAAKVRASSDQKNPIVIHVSTTASHDGEPNGFDEREADAEELSFLLN